MSELSRRSFLKTTGGTVAAATLASTALRPAHAASGGKIRHAVIGVGGQGTNHCRQIAENMGDLVDLVAICDLDPERREKVTGVLAKTVQVRALEDFKEVMADDTIQSVTVATPDHWHTPLALHALAAGKHVYVEKPCSHNVLESRALADAAAKTGLCVQHGVQSRSGQGIKDAFQFLREGNLGKVRLAKAINHQLREPIGRAPDSDPPPGYNYDVWLGPAPVRPFSENRFHYQWHWWWDYGTGDIGNDGVHQLDVARWGLGVEHPKAISASGGQLFYDDDHETPDTQVVTYEYDECYLMYEMRLWTDYKMEGHDNGVIFYGDKGTLEVGREGCHVTLKGEDKKKIGDGADFTGNIRNFFESVRDGSPAKLNGPIREGALSSDLAHFGNIATRMGRRLIWDESAYQFKDDPLATFLLGRIYRKGYELPIIS